MEELRAPLVAALEKLRDDLALGNYGDPYVAFVTMLHPDRHPSIVSLSPAGAHDMASIVVRAPGQGERPPDAPRFFGWEELGEATRAMHDAEVGSKSAPFAVDAPALGAHMDEVVRQRWQARRDAVMDRAMQDAAFEESHPAECPNCGRRFTDAGLAQHRDRSPLDACRTGKQQAPEHRPSIPTVSCPLRQCRWTGRADSMVDHIQTQHGGSFVVG